MNKCQALTAFGDVVGTVAAGLRSASSTCPYFLFHCTMLCPCESFISAKKFLDDMEVKAELRPFFELQSCEAILAKRVSDKMFVLRHRWKASRTPVAKGDGGSNKHSGPTAFPITLAVKPAS